jgi:hypothetical protein
VQRASFSAPGQDWMPTASSHCEQQLLASVGEARVGGQHQPCLCSCLLFVAAGKTQACRAQTAAYKQALLAQLSS